MRQTLFLMTMTVFVTHLEAQELVPVDPLPEAEEIGEFEELEVFVPSALVVPEPALPTEPPPEPPPKIWSGRVELGANGSDGNTERFSSRFGVDAERETDRSHLTMSVIYARSSADGEDVENKLLSDLRNEWKLHDSPWSIFAYGTAVYDEFQAWDVRVTSGGGLSYDFIDTERLELSGRFGGGFSRDFGGPDTRFIPELNFGSDFAYQLNDRNSLTATFDYFPNVADWGDWRANFEGAWEILLDTEWNLLLRFGILNRYQSRPDGARPNDLDYFAQLGWQF